MREFFEILQHIFNFIFFSFGFMIISSYMLLAIISYFALKKYVKKSTFTNYHNIISSPFAPGVSVIAPAYNESKTIIENINALLSLFYHDFEVIIINDGSTDDTLEKVINHFKLEKVNMSFDYHIPTQPIRGVYKSSKLSQKSLIVIDKENGGKADALNAGINISSKPLFTVIDVDSILDNETLCKLVKPFLEETDKTVIATGSVIHIANSCIIDKGQVIQVRFPEKWLARFQSIEYNRAFLLGRMAWGKLNGLLLISGAIGMFNKQVIVECGGYSTETVGEDMELIVRVRRYLEDKGEKYSVIYIPDPLCWTEAPETLKVLGKQRNRWTRGTIETLFKHSKLFFNPKYKLMGMFSYPYWFFFEWLAPIMEIFGLTYFTVLSILGMTSWPFFLLMLFFIYSFAVGFSIWSIFFSEISFNKYTGQGELLKQLATAFLEPFFYHPLVVFWAIKGNIDYFRGKKQWGKMDRKGFKTKNVQQST